jgi:hypothetical protein
MLLPSIRVVPFARDPLSVLYDDDARVILDRLYGLPMRGGAARTIAYVASPPFAARDDYDGSLTVQERAFLRSVYWNLARRRPFRSIRPDWSEDYVPGLGRPLTLTMFTLAAARAWSESHPERPRYADHPELRSAGRAS